MRVLRRRVDNAVQLGSFLVVAALVLWRSVSLPSLVIAAGFVVLAIRAFRSGVFIDDTAGITVRNTFGTHRIAWDDYARVDIGMAGLIAIAAIVIRRRDDTAVALWCVQPPGRGRRGAPRLVALLKDVQQAIRAVHPEDEGS